MKISITEFRDMVAEAVRRVAAEAKKKPKLTAPQSEDAVLSKREREIRALPGYAHGEVLDMSKPLGRKNLAKRQGASGMGGWTSEASDPGDTRATQIHRDQGDFDSVPGSKVLDAMLANGIPLEKAQKIMRQLSVDPVKNGLDDPSELGIETKVEAVRHLVRMIVTEEIGAVRGRR